MSLNNIPIINLNEEIEKFPPIKIKFPDFFNNLIATGILVRITNRIKKDGSILLNDEQMKIIEEEASREAVIVLINQMNKEKRKRDIQGDAKHGTWKSKKGAIRYRTSYA